MKIYKEPVLLVVSIVLAIVAVIWFSTKTVMDDRATVDGVSPTIIEVIKESTSGE